MRKMKKIFAICAALFVAGWSSIQAQTITYYYEGKALADGENIVFDRPTFDEYGSYGYEPEIFIAADQPCKINTTATTDGETVSYCFGTDCRFGSEITFKGVSIGTTQQNIQLHYSSGYEPDPDIWSGKKPMPTIKVTVEAEVVGLIGSKKSFTVTMQPSDAGVESVATAAKIAVVGKTLNYSLPGAATVEVYSLSGAKVLAEAVEGSGSLSLDGLSAGLYLYKVAGTENATGKFIVK